jgi:hypothetical protein
MENYPKDKSQLAASVALVGGGGNDMLNCGTNSVIWELAA